MKFSKTHLIVGAQLTLASLAAAQDGPRNIQIVYEAFSLPKSEAAELQRAGHDDNSFYQVLVAATKEKKAQQEKLLAIRTLPGQKSTVEQITELIVPTEYDPPELPNQVGLLSHTPTTDDESKGKAEIEDSPRVPSLFPSTPATPTAFDTYNLGSTLEIEPQLDESGDIVNLLFSSKLVRLQGMDTWGQGLSEAEVPRISRQAQTSSIIVRSGIPSLIGTISPPSETQDKAIGERVWFAFITATVIKSGK